MLERTPLSISSIASLNSVIPRGTRSSSDHFEKRKTKTYMNATIQSLSKEILPRFDAATNRDEPTIVMVAQVDFHDDTGRLVHSQSYAHLPEEYDAAYFDRQAAAMQAELDHTSASAKNSQRSAMADQILSRFHVRLGDGVPMNDQINQH